METSIQGMPPRGSRPDTFGCPRGLWAIVLTAASAGIVLTTIQILEKLAIVKNPGTVLICDVNATMSCSEVLTAWQSSVLGPPNALIGAVMFAVLGSAALAGVLRTRPTRGYLVTIWGLALFFLLFATWFMYETAFDIGRLCLWCTGITTSIVVICASTTRIVAREGALDDTLAGRSLRTAVRTGVDLIFWAGWWLAIAAMLWSGLTR